MKILTFSREDDSWALRRSKSIEVRKQRLDEGNSESFRCSGHRV